MLGDIEDILDGHNVNAWCDFDGAFDRLDQLERQLVLVGDMGGNANSQVIHRKGIIGVRLAHNNLKLINAAQRLDAAE